MLQQRVIERKDMLRCVLCENARCSEACGRLDCARLLRGIWFDNEQGAAKTLPKSLPCADCPAPCEDACAFPRQVPIKTLICRLGEQRSGFENVSASGASLRTDFCGIAIENPFLLSSSVVASSYDMCARAFDMGWAGVAYKTISLMDIREASPRFSAVKGSAGSIIGFKNIEQLSDHALVENLDVFRRLKSNYPDKLLLASIMGRDEAEWTYLSRAAAEAGADALELNFSCPNMTESDTGSDVGQIPELVERFTAAARAGSGLPILAKLTPDVSSMLPAAEAAVNGGADGLSAINTIKSITSVNLHSYVAAPAVRGRSSVGGYSGAAVKPIALRFVAELAQGMSGKDLHISGMGGVETWRDALEFMLLGARSVQVTTAVMQYGGRIIEDLTSGLAEYLAEKGLESVGQIVGAALSSVVKTDALERDSIVYPRFLRERCVGCGRCSLSCRDGGHEAIQMSASRSPALDPSRCVGCHLCTLVCPMSAIRPAKKRVVSKA